MSDHKYAKNHCVYRIATGSTLEELEKNVNDIIARGWDADGFSGAQWEIFGNIGQDGKGFFQVLIICPTDRASAARRSNNE